MNFGYNQVVKKRKAYSSRTKKYTTRILINTFKFLLYLVVLLVVVVGFTGVGMIKGIIDNILSWEERMIGKASSEVAI